VEHLIPEARAGARFAQLADGFERAFERCGSALTEFHGSFGGRPVVIRTAGRALAAGLIRPFVHLRAKEEDRRTPQLRIDVWDPDESAPAPHVASDSRENTVEVSRDGRFVHQSLPHGAVAFDRASSRIVGCLAWRRCDDVYHRGKPLARLLAEWYADRHVPIVHAALVASRDEGVLLAGRGGSGKSTFSVACARAGLGFAGEDYTALELSDGPDVTGHSAYNSAFLDPAASAWFPELGPHLVQSHDPAEPKSVVVLADVWPDRLIPAAAIRRIALCRLASTPDSRIRTAGRAEALLALAPSSLLQVHGRRRDSLDYLARLVESVPCFHVDLGRDLDRARVTVEHLLHSAG
jgi:hypothetical protein